MSKWTWYRHLAIHPRLQSHLHLWRQLHALHLYPVLGLAGEGAIKKATEILKSHLRLWSVLCAVLRLLTLQRGQTAADPDIWTSALRAQLQHKVLNWLFLSPSLSGSMVLLMEFGSCDLAPLPMLLQRLIFFLQLYAYQGTLCLLTKCFPTGNFLWWKTLGKLPVRGDAAGAR